MLHLWFYILDKMFVFLSCVFLFIYTNITKFYKKIKYYLRLSDLFIDATRLDAGLNLLVNLIFLTNLDPSRAFIFFIVIRFLISNGALHTPGFDTILPFLRPKVQRYFLTTCLPLRP